MDFLQQKITVVLNFVADNLQYFISFTALLTLLVLALSTKYALNNIFKLWNKGNPQTQNADETDDSLVRSEDVNWSTDDVNDDLGSGDAGPDPDPVQFCEHLQSEVKKARQRVAAREIQGQLTDDDMENEREVQRKQLEAIFKLMKTQQEKFGVSSVDDIHQQMKLYA